MSEISKELEAVAMAIYAADPCIQQPPISMYPWEKQNDATREVYRAIARAALLAIREPSEGMLHAMGVVVTERYVPIQEQNILDGYYAAIDHVLGAKT